jgi:hypothetical protein
MSRKNGTCADCGKPIWPTAKRCLSCSTKGPRNPNWNNFASTGTEHRGRERAQRRFELGPCVKCGEPATDRHHINADTLDNRPENVLTLCRRCHLVIDGRLDAIIERNRKRRIYKDTAERFRALRARRKAEGRPIRKKKK